MRTIFFSIAVLFFLLAVNVQQADGGVIGIDFGSLYYKIGLIMSRTFEIVLNEASSRKTATVVAYTNDDLHFGESATRFLTKYPQRVYPHPQELLGRKYNETRASLLSYQVQHDETRSTYGILHDTFFSEDSEDSRRKIGDSFFSTEEIVGLLINRIKEISDAHSRSEVKECVITVPAFYTQHQRTALIDAAKVGGLSVLSLINDGSAVAMDYAVSKKYVTNDTEVGKEQRIIFFDMGYSYTKVTLASFVQLKDDKKKNSTIPQVTILATAYENVGGRDFDDKLARFLASKANELKKIAPGSASDITKNKKAMAKLRKEAQKTKEVLSANVETYSQVESLVEDFDFKALVKRQEFEDLIQELVKRITLPIDRVLAEGNTTKKDLWAFEVFGGSTRVPLVQSTLTEYLGDLRLSRHINSDEAAAMGSAFYAALQSSSFRVTEFRLKDGLTYPVEVLVETKDDAPQTNLLFKTHSHLGSKRKLTVKSKDGANVTLSYAEPSGLPDDSFAGLAKYVVGAVPTIKEYNLTAEPSITLVFRLSSSGTIDLETAEAELQVTEEVVEKVPKSSNKTISNSTEESKAETTETETKKADEQNDDKDDGAKAETTNGNNDEKTDEKDKKKEKRDKKKEVVEYETRTKLVKRIHKVKLSVTKESLGYAPLTQKNFSQAKKRYASIFEKIDLKKKTEEARNKLESSIYLWREKVLDDQIVAASEQKERDDLTQRLDTNALWLEDEGANTVLTEYEKKLSDIHEITERIEFRIREQKARPEAIEAAKKLIQSLENRLANITNVLNVTEEERDKGFKKCENAREWLNTQKQRQDKKKLYEDPSLTSSDVMRKMEDLEGETKYLFRRPRKIIPKPFNSTTNSTTTAEDKSKQEGKDGSDEKGSQDKDTDANDKEDNKSDEDKKKGRDEKDEKDEKDETAEEQKKTLEEEQQEVQL